LRKSQISISPTFTWWNNLTWNCQWIHCDGIAFDWNQIQNMLPPDETEEEVSDRPDENSWWTDWLNTSIPTDQFVYQRSRRRNTRKPFRKSRTITLKWNPFFYGLEYQCKN
jgi:hypothetical protein